MGQPIDMDALAAKHESTRAVGNIDVNARGDIIDKNNNVVKSVNQRVAESNQDNHVSPPRSQLSQVELDLEDGEEGVVGK